MQTEQLFTELINEVGKCKQAAPHSELARHYAILFTDIQKAYAFYLTYLYPTEADMPPCEEIE